VFTLILPELVEKTDPKPMIGFTSIAKEGMMLLMWTKIPVATDYVPKPKKKKQKKGLPKEDDEAFEHYFLYIPRGILLLIQGNVAHSGSYCFGQNGLKQETNHHLHFIVAPMMPLKQMWIKGKTTTCWMTSKVMMRIFCMSC